MTLQDLRNYRPIERTPVRGSYRGYDIVAMPPSSSGGIVLIEMLNVLEGYALAGMADGQAPAPDDRGDEARLCRPRGISGRSRRCRAARAPRLERLRRASARAHRSRACAPGRRYGRASRTRATTPRISPSSTASATRSPTPTTLNFGYGLGLVAEGTGILLNNELDDFAVKPGAPNAYGLVGGDPNAPGPGKRPLSSMSPTIVLKDGKPFLVTGSPGGSRIITAVLQVIVNVIDRKLSIADAVSEPRVHHQWSPDEVFVERGFPPGLVRALEARGHKVVEQRPFTSANSILVTPQAIIGAADTRTRGALAAGY